MMMGTDESNQATLSITSAERGTPSGANSARDSAKLVPSEDLLVERADEKHEHFGEDALTDANLISVLRTTPSIRKDGSASVPRSEKLSPMAVLPTIITSVISMEEEKKISALQSQLATALTQVKRGSVPPKRWMSNFFGRTCYKISSNPWFDRIIIAVILFNCVLIARINEGMVETDLNSTLEIPFAIFFSLEALIKIVSWGGAYFRDGWNFFDFMMVVIAWVNVIPGVDNYTMFRAVRVLRTLRTLQAAKGMRKIITGLIDVIPAVMNVFLLWVSMFLIFGIVGLQLFSGVFRFKCGVLMGDGSVLWNPDDRSCDSTGSGGHTCALPETCLDYGTNPNYNITSFDNIFNSLLTVFQVITLEGWTDILYRAQDGLSAWMAAIYFILVAMVGGIFAVNLALAVIADSFITMYHKKEVVEKRPKWLEYSIFVWGRETQKAQKELFEKFNSMQSREEVPGLPRVRWILISIARNSVFETIMVLVICANCIVISMDRYGISDDLAHTLEVSNIIFTAIFTAEMALKMVAYGTCYLVDPFNRADIWIVLLAWIEVIALSGKSLSALRIFRLSRALKLIKSFSAIRQLLMTLYSSLTSIFYLTVILALFISVAALLGKAFFAGTMGAYRQNFDDFYTASVTVFQLLTGENWNDVWYNTVNGSNIFATFYFWIVIMLGQYLVVNLFLAVLISFVEIESEMFVVLSKLTVQLQGNTFSSRLRARAKLALARLSNNRVANFLRRLDDDSRFISRTESELELETSSQNVVGSRRGSLLSTANRVAPLPIVQIDPPSTRSNFLLSENTNSFPQPTNVPRSSLVDETDVAKPKVPTLTKGAGVDSPRKGPTPPSSGRQRPTPRILKPLPPPINRGRVESATSVTEPTHTIILPHPHLIAPIPRFEKPDALTAPSPPPESPVEETRKPGSYGNRIVPLPVFDTVNMMASKAALDLASYVPNGAPASAPGSAPGTSRPAQTSDVASPTSPATDGVVDMSKFIGKKNLARLVGSSMAENLRRKAAEREQRKSKELRGRSFFLFSPKNKLRVALDKLISTSGFTGVTITCIVLSSLSLTFNPSEGSPFSDALNVFDVIFTIIFSIEALFKMIVHGVFIGDRSYFRSGWNAIDFITVFTAILGQIFQNGNLSALKSLRTLRVLRPLRMLHRFPGLKVVINCMFSCVPVLFNISFVLLVFFFIFGVIGVSLFSGGFVYCSDPSIVGTKEDCLASGALWLTYSRNFDTIFDAMLTLFEISTTELWVSVMVHAVDSRGPELTPLVNYQPARALFLVVFLVIGSFVLLNLFVGGVVDNFNRMSRKESSGGVLLTEKQQMFIRAVRNWLTRKPDVSLECPENRARAFVFRIVTTQKFENLILLVIGMNTLTMGMDHFNASDNWVQALEICNYFFFAIFALEMLLKLFALKSTYFKYGWNVFDCTVVWVTLVAMLVENLSTASFPLPPTVIRCVRIVRVVRILRLMRSSGGLLRLLEALLESIPAMFNVFSVMLVFMFIFAIVSVQFFSGIKRGDYLDEHANFDTFGAAILLLVRMVTGENWDGVMRDCMVQPPDCDPTLNECGYAYAWIFFCIYVLFARYLLLNMVVAILLDRLSESLKMESEKLVEDVYALSSSWGKYDIDGKYRIPTTKLLQWLRSVPPPLGIGEGSSRIRCLTFLLQLEVPEREGSVYFVEAVRALVRHNFSDDGGGQFEEKFTELVSHMLPKLPPMPLASFTCAQQYASIRIQAAMRAFLLAKQWFTHEENCQDSSELSSLAGTVNLRSVNVTEEMLAMRAEVSSARSLWDIVRTTEAQLEILQGLNAVAHLMHCFVHIRAAGRSRMTRWLSTCMTQMYMEGYH